MLCESNKYVIVNMMITIFGNHCYYDSRLWTDNDNVTIDDDCTIMILPTTVMGYCTASCCLWKCYLSVEIINSYIIVICYLVYTENIIQSFYIISL